MRRRAQPTPDPLVRRRFDGIWSPAPATGSADPTAGGHPSGDGSPVLEWPVDGSVDVGAGDGVPPLEPSPGAWSGPHVPPIVRYPEDPPREIPPRAVAALAALNPGRRAVRALAVLGVVIVLIAGYVAWSSRPRTDVIAPVAQSSPAVVTVPVPPSGSAGSPSGTTLLVVAVTGRVHHPGLVRVPPGSRVADVIRAAGGALPDTDLSYVNLARKVADGELIVIGLAQPPDAGGAATPATGGAGGTGGGPIDLNTATASDLDTLPGIGPALAARILDYRTRHGGFHSIDELRNVPGIGDAKFAEVKDLVTV